MTKVLRAGRAGDLSRAIGVSEGKREGVEIRTDERGEQATCGVDADAVAQVIPAVILSRLPLFSQP